MRLLVNLYPLSHSGSRAASTHPGQVVLRDDDGRDRDYEYSCNSSLLRVCVHTRF